MESVPVVVPVAEQVVSAMYRCRWRDHEPRTVAHELGLSWSLTDEERWYSEYARCAACHGWMSAQDDGFCQCCLAC